MLCRYTGNTYCRNKNNFLLNEFVLIFIYAFLAKASHHYERDLLLVLKLTIIPLINNNNNNNIKDNALHICSVQFPF